MIARGAGLASRCTRYVYNVIYKYVTISCISIHFYNILELYDFQHSLTRSIDSHILLTALNIFSVLFERLFFYVDPNVMLDDHVFNSHGLLL